MSKIIIDSNVLIGILDERDSLSSNAIEVHKAIRSLKLEIMILDCVVNEAISVICRRLEEQKRGEFLDKLMLKLDDIVDPSRIIWAYNDVHTLYPDILQMIQKSKGKINFHDALILLSAKKDKIVLIASFDRDFDNFAYVKRVFDVKSLQQAI